MLTKRHVVLLDDLVDGGGTTDFTEHHLYGYGAETVERIVLVKKLKDPPVKCNLAMYGFEAPDLWLRAWVWTTPIWQRKRIVGRDGSRLPTRTDPQAYPGPVAARVGASITRRDR